MRPWRGLSSRIIKAIEIKEVLRRLHLLVFAKQIRSTCWSVRDRWLAFTHTKGKFVRSSNNAIVFCNFNDPNYRWYYGDNLFLEQEHKAFERLLELKEPCVVIDIGAHWGIFPALLDVDKQFASRIKHVVCIEPDPNNIPCLRKTISKIKNFQVTIVESAIGDLDSTIFAYRDGGSCLQTYSSHKGEGDLKVPVQRLETILKNLGINPNEVTHIKIDIDGYEPNFFFGNQELLRTSTPLVMTEYWAKGLRCNTQYMLEDYYALLQENYYMLLCNYPEGNYSILKNDDIEVINALTQTAVANILLVPKTIISLPNLKKEFLC